ncbi:atlastin-like [Rhodnius prolixus]
MMAETTLLEERTYANNCEENLPPCAVQIVKTDDSGHKFILDETSLEKLLMNEKVREKYVSVVSVAGAFRKGKSFLLDFFLRYLDAKYKKCDITDWLGPNDIPLEGFCWKGGSERVTAGILMWSDVYITTTPTGQEAAIILLDTQGTFDSNSTVCDCATIFALSTMVSSVQVYNISQNIQEDDLQHLELFAEYGRLALANCGRVPFQKLMFLIRDWSFPYEAKYGLEGGRQLLEKRLKIKPNQHSELQFLRRHIKSCFSDINCYLMPHPGLKVATNPYFDGKLIDIEPEFLYYIENLAPLILAPENLTLKTVNGQIIKAKELYLYFKSYTKIFSGNELPEPKSMLVATAEANHLAALAAAKENYVLAMEEYCGGTRPYLKSSVLEQEHNRQKSLALECFSNKRKMGSNELTEAYCVQLNNDIEQMYLHFKSHNESKNIFKAARTPAVFMTLAIVTYVLSNFMALISFNTLASFCSLITTLAIITLLTWFYTRYSGEYADISLLIDTAADRLWENLMKPTYLSMVQNNDDDDVEHPATSRTDKIASS